MPKRSPDRPHLRSKYEQARVNQSSYSQMEADEMKKPKYQPVHRNHAEMDPVSSVVITDPNAFDARKCYQCECTNDKGFCDNYLLYAVMRQMCKQPVKEAT